MNHHPNANHFARVAGMCLCVWLSLFSGVAQSDTYQRTPNAAISGHNNKHISGSVEQCKRACDSEEGFVCKSFDYYKEQRACDLSDKRAADVGGLKRNYAGNPYDHYERQSGKVVVQTVTDGPSGILELQHRAGYVAKFLVTWMEPIKAGGIEIMVPKLYASGNVTLGWSHVVYFAPGAKNVNIAIDGFKFIGVTKEVYRKQYKNPPNTCLKIYATIVKPKTGGCSKSDFAEGLASASKFINKQKGLIKLVSDHLKGRSGKIDDALRAIANGQSSRAASDLDLDGLFRKLKSAGVISSSTQMRIPTTPYARTAVYRPGQDFGELVPASTRGGRGTFFDDVRSVTLTAGSNLTLLTGVSSGVGAAFSTRKGAAKAVTGVESVAWQVCCGIGASAGLTLGLWTDEPLDLSGVAWGITMSLGDVGGVTVTAWAPYDDDNHFGGTGDFSGLEISADFTTPSADVAYIRGWTCAFADRNKCTDLHGNPK